MPGRPRDRELRALVASCPGTDPATVRRLDDATWVIETGPDDLACIREDGEVAGYYRLPMSLLLELPDDTPDDPPDIRPPVWRDPPVVPELPRWIPPLLRDRLGS